MSARTDLRWVWQGALTLFVLAALTGFLYRLDLSYGGVVGLDLTNMRHAHSHLMYFGWVTPTLFALIARQVTSLTGRRRPPRLGWILVACFGAALLSYPLFLTFGYRPVAVGSARLPLAVIASTLNMVAWYAFVLAYVRMTSGLKRTMPVLLWDASLVFLVLATLGGGGLALLTPLGIDDPAWSAALIHIFLDYFSEGWFVLAVLGLVYAEVPGGTAAPSWPLYLIGAGLPTTFVLGMPASLVSMPLTVSAGIGGTLVAAGLLACAWHLWNALDTRRHGGQPSWLWRIPLGLLAVKALAQLVLSVTPAEVWSSTHGLRILYLHLMLLGFVSLGILAAADKVWGRRAVAGRGAMYAAVCLVLASLVPLTPLWPAAWSGRWPLLLATWLSLLPAAAALRMLVASFGRQPRRPDLPEAAPAIEAPRPTRLAPAPALDREEQVAG